MPRSNWTLLPLAMAILLGMAWASAAAVPMAPTTHAQDAGEIVSFDLWMGTSSSEPRFLTVLGDVVVFSAADGANGRELWTSDGTPDGTHLLKDIRPGVEGSNPIAGGESERNPVPLDARTRFTQVDDRLYFVANDGEHGREIWMTDGTEDGTRMLADITEGAEEWGIAAYLTAHEGRLFFSGDDGFDGEELWVSDGTESGTTLLKDIMDGPAGSLPSHLASTPVGLAFAAEHFDYGVEPWISDGTEDGTTMLGDLAPDLDGSDPTSFIGFEGAVLFGASDLPDGANAEPWTSDGTERGTRLLRDLNPGGRGFNAGYTPHGDELYFAGDNGMTGSELWATDGTEGGTRLVADVAARGRGSIPSELAGIGNLLFFSAFHFSYGIEAWVTDGTESGTRVLGDLNPGGVPSSRPAEATELGNQLYFSADLDGSGRELWSTDGTGPGTRMVAEILPGGVGSDPTGLLAHDGKLYFAAQGPDLGTELHVLGGEPAPATEVPPTPGPTQPPATKTPGGPMIYMPYADKGSGN